MSLSLDMKQIKGFKRLDSQLTAHSIHPPPPPTVVISCKEQKQQPSSPSQQEVSFGPAGFWFFRVKLSALKEHYYHQIHHLQLLPGLVPHDVPQAPEGTNLQQHLSGLVPDDVPRAPEGTSLQQHLSERFKRFCFALKLQKC